MEVKSSINVTLSSHDTLRSKVSKHCNDLPWIEVAALGVCKKAIFGTKSEWHVTSTVEKY
jgi:hypothetical protein